MTVEYHRPAQGPLTLRARVARQGRSVVLAEVSVE
jgi:acyl-coenzyme A thioesterase PaaI-like protein